MIEIKTEAKGLVSHGVSACAGCGIELLIRNVLAVVGRDTIIVIPPGCSALFCGYGKETGMKIAGFQGNLENSAAYASGIRAGLEAQGNDHTTVLVFAGDGGTADIGLQSLSGMLERGDRVLYICYDNEAYMNTGIQASSSTPFAARTTTTPAGKPVNHKDLLGIVRAHNIHYCAAASIAYLPDLRRKVEKAMAAAGPSFLHIHCPCPTGWGYDPSKSIEVCRKAVQTGAWMLYECEDDRLTINVKPSPLNPLAEYVKMQSRFSQMSDEEIAAAEAQIAERCRTLTELQGLRREGGTP